MDRIAKKAELCDNSARELEFDPLDGYEEGKYNSVWLKHPIFLPYHATAYQNDNNTFYTVMLYLHTIYY